MIKNSVIIIPNISHYNKVCDYLEQTSRILAHYNNKVFVIYHNQAYSTKEILIKIVTKKELTLYKKANGIYYLYPIHLIPFKRIAFIKKINSIIFSSTIQLMLKIKYFNANNYLIWIFFPQSSQFVKVKFPFWKIIFDIVDFHTSPNDQKQKQLTRQKKVLLKKSSIITTNSYSLKSKYSLLTKKMISVVPQGFSSDQFNIKKKKTDIILSSDKPLIGFIGQISQRLDLNILNKLIKQNKQWNFVFVGPKHSEPNISTDQSDNFLKKFEKLTKYNNCFWVDSQPKNEIGSIIQQLDICTIPYNIIHDFNKYCYPMKIFEYFYIGKPVISTPIEELKHQKFNNLVKIGNTSLEWEKHIKTLLEKPWAKEYQKKQHNLAIANSWKNKIEVISSIIQKLIT